jgi:hypothetical protein
MNDAGCHFVQIVRMTVRRRHQNNAVGHERFKQPAYVSDPLLVASTWHIYLLRIMASATSVH